MNKYVIQNEHGQYWTGTCWGTKEAAEEHNGTDALPNGIPDLQGTYHYLWWNSLLPSRLDAGYGKDNFARVYLVK